MVIGDFANKHAGKRCFLIGGGLSLAGMDLSGLRDEITFSCNNGYLLFERMGFPTTYWAVEDVLDVQQFGDKFRAMKGPIKFAADDCWLGGDSVSTPFSRVLFDAWPPFSMQPPFHFGGTVMYLMLQLAAYMGCSTAYLLGNDFRWTTDRVESESNRWTTRGVDENHFDPNYWPKGTKSFPPQPDRMRRAFQAALLSGAMRIVNVTPGSALDVFETDDYEAVLQRDTPDIPMEQIPSEIADLKALLRGRRLHHVVELGVRGGGTAALWHGLSTGLVIGVDKAVPGALAARLPRFRSVQGDSHSPATVEAVAGLLGGQPADFLFVDGDHTFRGSAQDYETYRRFVRPGGLIAFHDITSDPRHFETWEEGGVPRFWRELKRDDKVEFTERGDWGGIGVVTA